MSFLDSSASKSSVTPTNASLTCSITTSLPNDLIVLFVFTENNSTAIQTVSSVSGGGLTWTRRTQSISPTHVNVEIWWAVATSATTIPITATFTGSVDNPGLVAIAIQGANNSAPWDTNSSLPAHASYTSTSTPSFSGRATDTTNTLALFVVGTNGNFSYGTIPSGYMLGGSVTSGVGSGLIGFGVAMQGEASTLSAYAKSWGSTVTFGTGSIEAVFDAIALSSPWVTESRVTQVAVEEWGGGGVAQVSQIAVEQWASLAVGSGQALVTQVAVEQWAVTATTVTSRQTAVTVVT